MTGEERRASILAILKQQGPPLSGTALAKQFHVSRQVIVQDIALMRAENHRIRTPFPSGYFCKAHHAAGAG